MSLPDEIRALRTGTALHEPRHVVALRVGGDAAFATLDQCSSATLALQDTQVRPSLFLREGGDVFADVLIARDDERYLLFTEGPRADEVMAFLRAHAAPGALVLEDLAATHGLLSVHGPWSWDLLAELVGPDVVGMPYLTFIRAAGDLLCFRTGKTGEYGYDLLLPGRGLEAFRERLISEGAAWALTPVSLEALDHCALENWFFNARREGRSGLTPDELGLRWRLAPGKAFAGSRGLLARRAQGVHARLTCLEVEGPVAPGDAVRFEGREVGKVLNAGESPLLERWVAAALLELPLAVPGVSGFTVKGAQARTRSPPVVNNRSLYVSAQRHTWADRDSGEFPPLVR